MLPPQMPIDELDRGIAYLSNTRAGSDKLVSIYKKKKRAVQEDTAGHFFHSQTFPAVIRANEFLTRSE